MTGGDREEGRLRDAAILGAAALLGLAVMAPVQPLGLVLLGGTIFLAGLGAFGRRLPSLPSLGARPDLTVARGAVVCALPGLVRPLAALLPSGWPVRTVIAVLLLGALAVAAWVCLGDGVVARRSFVVLVVGTWLLGLLLLWSADPVIDVRMFQEDASRALLAGSNPFAMTFPDLYPPAASDLFYGPGISVGGTLMMGFPYPPLSLLLVAPAEVLFGDFRLAQLTAVVVAAVVIGSLGRGARSRSGAVVLLAVAPVLHIVVNGWTEPLLVLALALTVLAHTRRSSATPYVFGLLVALKQYVPLLLPAYLKLLDPPVRGRTIVGHGARILATVALVTVPFLLLDPGAFWWSVVELQFHQPLRADALSFLVGFVDVFGALPELAYVAVPVVAAVAATIACLRWIPSGGRGFALTAGFVMLVWFALTKQSFANHYFFVIGALCVAAAVPEPSRVDSTSTSPG